MKKFKNIIVLIVIICSSFCFYGCQKTDLENIAKNKTQYIMNLSYNHTEHTLSGEQTIRYVNNTSKVLTNDYYTKYS